MERDSYILSVISVALELGIATAMMKAYRSNRSKMVQVHSQELKLFSKSPPNVSSTFSAELILDLTYSRLDF